MAFGVSGLAYWYAVDGRGALIPRLGVWHLLVAIAYLGYWFVVIPRVTLRMALLPAVGLGQDQLWLDHPVQV